MHLSRIPFFLFSVLLLLVGLQLHANVLGDMQTFAPNTDGLDFITVHTARPMNKYEGFFAFGGHFSYAKDQLAEFDLTISYIKNYRKDENCDC